MCRSCWPFTCGSSNTQEEIAKILCQRCQKIFAKGKVYDEGVHSSKVHPSIASVQSAADDGCRLCTLLRISLHDDIVDSPIFFSLCGDNQQLDLHLTTGHGFSRVLKLHWKPTSSSTLVPATTLGRSNSCSSASLTNAKRWYTNCINTHATCSRINPGEILRGSWNPTRLLDLGETGQNGRVHSVHSVHSDELPDTVPYTALSHCWGKLRHLILVQSNLASLQEGVPVEHMSKTFSDAITITRRLGIRYIWIDSLCIIQDSEDDWLTESSTMGKLYRYCQVCIAADAAKDGRFGCFVQRDLRTLRIPMKRPLRMGGYGAHAPTDPGSYECSIDDPWEVEVENSTLSKRAWAYQERILARRILHFGASQVFWECGIVHASESDPGYKKSIRHMNDVWAPGGTVREDPLAIQQQAYTFWCTAVEAYAPKLLTKNEDKLVAIAGVARTVQNALKDQYVAGLWRANLLQGLLWSSIESNAPSPASWRAPTWSWASKNSGIIMYRYYGVYRYSGVEETSAQELASIVNVETRTVGPDALGAITEARLAMFGRICSAMINVRSSGELSLGILMPDLKFAYIADSAHVCSDHLIKARRMAVFCLPVLFEKEHQDRLFGLLLKSCTGSEASRTYERVGTFNLDRNDIAQAYWPERFGSGVLLVQDERKYILDRLYGSPDSDFTFFDLE